MEHESKADDENSAAAHFRRNPTAPVRILVSTATHLVPGDGFVARTDFIANLISQYHWNHAFKWGHDRFESYNADFGYDNRTCYFLIDHGRAPDNDAVPILWYRWTGESLIRIHGALPSRIRRRLKSVPFTPVPRTEPRPMSATERRQNIRASLHRDMKLSDEDFAFLRESPEHAIWLERNIEARFWSKYKSLEAEWQESERQVA
ncbi:hypothetical protein F5X99DRAFT_406522 [Biscogniauxia marginata]|nr:hypothetical protein F5X99DRAFT_406522 [Biscogniauxia marginata]